MTSRKGTASAFAPELVRCHAPTTIYAGGLASLSPSGAELHKTKILRHRSNGNFPQLYARNRPAVTNESVERLIVKNSQAVIAEICQAMTWPSKRTVWEGITRSMFPRAGLDESEQRVVQEFLYNNSKTVR